MRNTHCKTWNNARNTEKCENVEIHTVGPGIWQEIDKHGKWDRNTVWLGIWWAKLKNMKNEKCIL